jgi:hypothetical protein
MEVFEIHVTGDESIHENTDLKTIAVDLLRPDGSVLRTEHMTSHVGKFPSYIDCKLFVDKLARDLESKGTKIVRVKIETPYYEHYVSKSLYLESHFEDKNFEFPTSRNQRKSTLLATERAYEYDNYEELRASRDEVELCLYDSWVNEDKDWFDAYECRSTSSNTRSEQRQKN